MTRWGLVSTILAPVDDILRFAAFHLDAGAHRLYLYLDDPNSDAFAPLKAHPKIRVTACTPNHWKKLGGARPDKHQVRQSRNATHAYGRKQEVDWVIHMDVDEFIVSDQPITDTLGAIDPSTLCARIRPMEQLAGTKTDMAFKDFIPNDGQRAKIVADLYPEFGAYVKGGFLSHVAGKVFVRTGLPDMSLRIHNVFQGDIMNPQECEIAAVKLAHCHAKTWEDWQAAYAYRLEKGSYRAELAPAKPREKGGLSLHELFQTIQATQDAEQDAGGLRAFYDEVIRDTPQLRTRLRKHDLLVEHDLALDAKLARQFG